MLVSKDINPQKSIYFLGAKIIEVIIKKDNNFNDLIDLFNELSIYNKISFHLFTLTIDWLYLIGLIELDDEGNILCI